MTMPLLRTGTDMRAPPANAGEAAEPYRIWADGPILRIEARGVWDVATAEAYAAEVKQIVEEMRAARPELRVIADRSDTPVFGPGVSEILMATYGSALREGDRVALVVDNSLAKVHVRQVAGREETQAFLSISAARTWVLAYG